MSNYNLSCFMHFINEIPSAIHILNPDIFACVFEQLLYTSFNVQCCRKNDYFTKIAT